MPRLMAVAEDVQKVHAICVRCGALANHSHRLSKSEDLVLLGEKDIYEPLCRECFNAAREREEQEDRGRFHGVEGGPRGRFGETARKGEGAAKNV